MDLTAGETFCLRLTQFGDNIKATWQQLQVEKNFCDVTLACKDGQIPTHKIIISHSSPVLKNILNQNSNQNQVIYVRSVKFKYLEKLVSFMYEGEVTVAEEDLREFLDVAEDLKVKGLSEENGELFIPSEEHPSTTEEAPPGKTNEKLHKNLDGELLKQNQQNYREPSPKRKRNTQKSTKLISNESVPTATAASPDIENDVSKENIFQILEPEKNTLSNMSKEKYNAHNLVLARERQFSCNKCNKQYTEKYNLTEHKASAHEGVRYPCDQCDVVPFSWARGLRQHKASAHEGVRYPCDQCDVSPFNQAQDLGQHKASAHEGVRYPCDQCDVAPFTAISGLRRHKASAHEGVRYECNTCDYKATRKSNLKQHTKKYHNI